MSHPNLRDPNFSKTIVFLSAHSEEMGTVGVDARPHRAVDSGSGRAAHAAMVLGAVKTVGLMNLVWWDAAQ